MRPIRGFNINAPKRLRSHRSILPATPIYTSNSFSTTSKRYAKDASKPATAFDARQLADLNQRIGKCITFGLKGDQIQEAAKLCEQLGRDWRELIAGSEGYLTGKDRRGLYRHSVPWGDQDSMVLTTGHVNNVMYNRYAETGRVNWAVNIAEKIDPSNREAWNQLVTPKSHGIILRKITTDFKFPMKFPDRISVYHKIRSAPLPENDGFILDVLILSEKHRRPAARLMEDLVLYDYQKGKKMTFDAKPFMLDVFQETHRLQEEAALSNSERARQLTERVQALEKDSWDRPDAKEDFGGSR